MAKKRKSSILQGKLSVVRPEQCGSHNVDIVVAGTELKYRKMKKGAGPFLAFKRLYLACGGVNLDRCSRSPGNRGKASSQGLPIANRLFAGGI